MSHFRTFLIVLFIVISTQAAFAQINIVNFDFGAVRIVCTDGYAYEQPVTLCPRPGWGPSQNFNASPGFGWILGTVLAVYGQGQTGSGGPGLTGPNTAFCPPSFDGLPFNQAVVLQDFGSFVEQRVSGFTTGGYTLSFYLGGRCYSSQSVAALVDGNVVGTWAVEAGMPFTLETTTFTVTSDGVHTIQFMGLNHGDKTAFLSYVVVTPNSAP